AQGLIRQRRFSEDRRALHPMPRRQLKVNLICAMIREESRGFWVDGQNLVEMSPILAAVIAMDGLVRRVPIDRAEIQRRPVMPQDQGASDLVSPPNHLTDLEAGVLRPPARGGEPGNNDAFKTVHPPPRVRGLRSSRHRDTRARSPRRGPDC